MCIGRFVKLKPPTPVRFNGLEGGVNDVIFQWMVNVGSLLLVVDGCVGSFV